MPRTKKAGKEKKAARAESAAVELVDGPLPSVVATDNAPMFPEIELGPSVGGISMLGQSADIMRDAQRILMHTRGSRKNAVTDLKTMDQVRQRMLPFQAWLFQYLFGSYGIAHTPGSLFEIIGLDAVGKSTLAWTIIGWALQNDCAALYQHTESKQLLGTRIVRCLHTNPVKAVERLSMVPVEPIFSLSQAAKTLEEWCAAMRGETSMALGKGKKLSVNYPLHRPLVAVLDSWSKLLSDEEANGTLEYADYMDKDMVKKHKETGDTSNLGHAVFASKWCRRLPHMCQKYNLIVIWIHHQTTKIDMGSRPTYLPQSYLDLNNRNHLGGRASNQNAAYQVVLTEAGPFKLKKDAEEPVGKKISAKCHKSSFGANQRQVGWDLITQPWLDSSDYLQPAIDFSRGTLDLLVRNKLLDLVVDGGAVTSKTLGITAVTSQEFLRAFYAHPDVVRDLGKRLRIEGMYGIEDLVAGNTSFNAPEIESGEEPEPDVPA